MSLTNDEQDNKAEDLFLAELKLQFEREIDLRKNLDIKATAMITIASTLITINLAIGTFLIGTLEENHLFYYISIGILALGIFLAVKAIWRLISSYGLRDYDYPFGHSRFFKNNEYDESMVDGVRSLTESQFKDRMFRSYLECIKTSDRLNRDKSLGIHKGQISITYT